MPLPRSLTSAPHQDLDLRLVSGTWPDGLGGEVWLSAPQAEPGLPYALFGFGVLVRLSLRPGTFGAAADRWAWRPRLLDTPTKLLRDAAPQAFAPGTMGWSSPFGAPNMANTAPLPWGDRLFATWDVGRPVEVDPATMAVLGEVGHRDHWGAPSLPGKGIQPFLFSSAHPIVDPDRACLWTVKLVPVGFEPMQMQVVLVRWSGEGTVVDTWPVEGAVIEGSMHTITQTRDWLVLADSGNFKPDTGEVFGGERTVTIDDEVPVFLVRKEVVEATAPGTPVGCHRFPLAPTTGHFTARYDDADGIHVLFEHMDRVDLGHRIRPDDRDAFGRPVDPAYAGLYNMAMGPSSVSEVRFDPATGSATREALVLEPWSWNHQLSAMDWSTEGTSAPTLHHLVFQGFHPEAVTARALAAYGDRVERSRFPAEETPASLVTFRRGGLDVAARWQLPSLGDLPSSPVFVPRQPGGPGRSRYAGTDPGGHDGWVVCPVLSDDGFRIDVFDAGHVDTGPIATLAAPAGEVVPLLLHSAWAPRAATAPDHERLRLRDELDAEALADLDDDLRRAAHTAAERLDVLAGRAP